MATQKMTPKPEVVRGPSGACPTGPRSRALRLERAQGIVEFALTLPVLLMLVIGIMEFGRLMFTYIAVVTAAREAARFGASTGISSSGSGLMNYQDCDEIRRTAIRIGSIAGLANNDASVQIRYIGERTVGAVTNRFTALGDCPPGGTGPTLSMGDRIVVTTTATFVPAQGIVPNLPIMQVVSLSRRTLLISVPVR